eukprot:403334347
MFEKNSTPDPNSEFSNYMIVDGNGSRFGDIIQLNQNLSSFLEMGQNSKEDSKNLGNIQDLMPQLIKQKHHLFLDRYKKTGQTLVINQKIVLFVRKQSGYVVPVEVFVKFHYSVQYQYVFLALVKPIYEIAPFSNQVKYNSNQLIFMITDNEEGHIYEYSETCVQLLGFRKDFEVQEIRKSIDNALDDLNFKKLIKDRRKRYLQNEIYEDIHTLNIEAFEEITTLWDYETKASDKLNRIHQLKNLQQNVNLDASHSDDLLKVRVKARLFEERYCGGVLDLNIFCFMIMDETNTDQSNIFTLLNNQGGQEKSGYSTVYQIKNLSISPQNFTDFQNLALSDKKYNEKEQEENVLSHMDLQSIQSHASSTTSQVQLRHAFSIEQRTTPRSMKIMFQLVFILYLIMLIISSINLGINIARQKQSEQDINIVQLNYQRLSQVSKVQLYKIPTYQLSMNKTVNNQISSTISYKPTPAEQTTYFVLQNGIKGFTYAAYQLLQQYVEDSSMHANSNIQITQVLTIVSCLTIITIGVIFAPMFSRAEIRDIKAVSFFLNLNNKLIPQLIKNCEYCLNMQDFKRNEQIQQDYEDVLGVQIRNQQIEQLKQARDQHINIVNQMKSYHGSTVNQSDYSGSMMIDGKNEKHSQSDSGSNSPYLSEENSNQMQNLEDLEQIAEFQRAQLEKQEKIDQEILTQKLKRVDQKIKRIILRLTLISLAVTVTLSSYFIISYFLALETFTTAADVNYTLASINQRQSCFQNTLNFYRETIIRMEMTPFYTQQQNESGVDFMFKNCYPLEQNYNKIRKYRPSYLEQAMTKIEKIESREFCDFVYQEDIQNLNSICKTASDGIFKQGLLLE